MSLLQINFDSFSSAKLYQQRISCLHVVMKKIYNFFKKYELPKFILVVKLVGLLFSVVSGVEMKTLQRLEQAHFLILQASA